MHYLNFAKTLTLAQIKYFGNIQNVYNLYHTNKQEYYDILNQIIYDINAKIIIRTCILNERYILKPNVSVLNVGIMLNKRSFKHYTKISNYILYRNMYNLVHYFKSKGIETYGKEISNTENSHKHKRYIFMYIENKYIYLFMNNIESHNVEFLLRSPPQELISFHNIELIIEKYKNDILGNKFFCGICFKKQYFNQNKVFFCINCSTYIDYLCIQQISFNNTPTREFVCPHCRFNPAEYIAHLSSVIDENNENSVLLRDINKYNSSYMVFEELYESAIIDEPIHDVLTSINNNHNH